MRSRILRIAAVLAALVTFIFACTLHTAARDITYDFQDIGMSVRVPDTLRVITRSAARNDKIFADLNLDYDQTITAYRNANIYLCAYENDGAYQISLSVISNDNSKAVNNYSDLTPAQRSASLEAIRSSTGVTSAVEVKRNGYIFFDYKFSTQDEDKAVYISQMSTVINGKQIDFSMKKTSEQPTADEEKVMAAIAGTVSFPNVGEKEGAVFEWWRLILWVFIIVLFTVAISLIYRKRNEAKKRLMEERRRRRAGHNEPTEGEGKPMTFEQALGYSDDEEFASRADADEMAGYDISVKEKDPSKGISYFEDEGSGIDDGSDYFDTYFEEPVENRSTWQKISSAVSSWFDRTLKHIGYFFKNLKNKIFSGKKKNKK